LGRDELLALEGFGEKSVDNLLDAIKESKNRPLWRLVAGLGIRSVGAVVAQTLTREFVSMDELLAADEDRLESIAGLGPETARNVAGFFSQERNRHLLEKLRGAGVRLSRLPEEEVREEGPLSGLTFVITGTLPTMSRDAATEFIEALGGRVTSGVSGNTSYLLVGEQPGSAKVKRAEDLGVRAIGEEELRQLSERG
jgi:DNA ligase (NAD+)